MAQININGIIGEDYSYSNFLTDFANAGSEAIRLQINSVGGGVEDGEAIGSFIASHADRFISVVNTGDVASIAASIFLSLPREKRFFDMSKGIFLIHNPFLDPLSLAFSNTDTTAEGMRLIADQLSETETRIAKFIEKQTGTDIDVVRGLMKINQPLTEEQMTALNIGTIYSYQSVAFFKPITINNNKMTHEELSTKLEENNVSLFSLIKAWMKKTTRFVALLVTDATGAQLEFPDVPDGVDPIVGDVAKYTDGTVPTGDVVMADGSTVTFDNGTITAIQAPAEEEAPAGDDMEALKAENETLKAELEALQTEKESIKAEIIDIKAMIKSQGVPAVPSEAPAEGANTTKTRLLKDILK